MLQSADPDIWLTLGAHGGLKLVMINNFVVPCFPKVLIVVSLASLLA